MTTLFRRRRLRSNAVANLSGRVVPGVLTLASIPVLVRELGPEAYGLIGFFAVLLVMFTTLDQGLTTTAAREVAAYRSSGRHPASSRTLLRSLEAVYWPIGFVSGCVIAGASGWLATNWLNAQELSSSDLELSLIAGGIAIAARWPVSLYRGVLDGLELQVVQNTVTVGAAAVRILGGVAFVVFVESSVVAFMAWQAIVTCLEVVVVAAVAWVSVEGGLRSARVDTALLLGVWRYATALNIIAVLGLVITQVDRVVISYLLPLASLGYYSIALAAAVLIPHVAAAVSVAVFPRFAAAQARHEPEAALGTYRQANEIVAYIAVGAAFTLAFYPSETLRAWVNSETAVEQARTVLALLALAYLLNALYAIPYTLAIATGHVRVPLGANLVGAPALVVVMIPAVQEWGLVGAAAAWLGLMASFFVAYAMVVHRRILRHTLRRYVVTIARYVVVGLALFGGSRILAAVLPEPWAYVCLAAALITYALSGLALLPEDVPLPRIRLNRLAARRS